MPRKAPPSPQVTEPALPRRRCAGLALATVLALAACSASEPAESSPLSASGLTATAGPRPSESTPAPGEWTLEDLKVGATVPKEDLERLLPT